MADIQFSGLVSGLDTGALIDGLVGLERGTINLLAAKKVKFQSQDVALSLLSGSLAGVKTSAQALSLSIDFDQKTVTSSDTGVLTVSTDSTAQAGSHNVVVTTLAKAKSLQSSTQTSSTAEVGTGTLTVLS